MKFHEMNLVIETVAHNEIPYVIALNYFLTPLLSTNFLTLFLLDLAADDLSSKFKEKIKIDRFIEMSLSFLYSTYLLIEPIFAFLPFFL